MKGKKLLTFIVLGTLLVGTSLAAVLTYFGKTTTTIDVSRAMTLDGDGCSDNECTQSLTAFGGETKTTNEYTTESKTSVDIPIEIVSTTSPNDGGVDSVTPEYNLHAEAENPREARIRVGADQIGLNTLNDLDTISFTQDVIEGYVGHVDIRVIKSDGTEDALVFEYDKVDDGCGNGAPYPTGVMDTFGDKGTISSTSYAWLSSGAAGNCQGDPNYIVGTLENWKAGSVDGSIDGDSEIVALEFEADSWISTSTVKMKDLTVNGELVTEITAQAGLDTVFKLAITFANGAEGTYTVDTEVQVN